MKLKEKLPSSAKLLLIEIQKNSIDGICKLKDVELAELIEKSHRHTVLLLAKLKKTRKVKTERFGSTEREIKIIDNSLI